MNKNSIRRKTDTQKKKKKSTLQKYSDWKKRQKIKKRKEKAQKKLAKEQQKAQFKVTKAKETKKAKAPKTSNQNAADSHSKAWLWPLTALLLFLYFENVFAISTGSNLLTIHYLGITVFALLGSAIYYALTSILPRKARRICKGILLLLLAFIYGSIYFVFSAFRMFYDLRTMISGAGGLQQFLPATVHMFASFNGVLHIVLLLLPFILYVALLRRFEPEYHRSWIPGLCGFGAALILFAGSRLLLSSDSQLADTYYTQYDFSTSLRSFGVSGTLPLEIRELLLPRSSEDMFEVVDYSSIESTSVALGGDTSNSQTADSASSTGTDKDGQTSGTQTSDIPSSAAQSSDVLPSDVLPSDGQASKEQLSEGQNVQASEEPLPAEPIDYGVNALDIDFAALAETTSGSLASMDKYVASLTPSNKNQYTGLFKGKNLILITAEAFTEEVIDPERTPTLYRMATKGIQFNDYYQPATAGTTGGEFGVIMGMLPGNGGSSMKDAADNYNYMTMGTQLCNLGYYGKAFHNYTHTVYSRNITHNALGYSDGFMGMGSGMEKLITSQWPESDAEMMEATLPLYIDKQPFNIYYMTVSGHSLYLRNKNKQTSKHWAEVEDLDYSERVRGYLAAQLEFEAAMTYLINALEEAGIADDTVICISSDHFPYGLDTESDMGKNYYLSELYGEEISDTFIRDHNRLILWSGCLENMDPIVVDSPTFSPDILPTLLNLFGVDYDSRLLPGRDALSDAPAIIYTLGYDWRTDLGYYLANKNKFFPYSEDTEIPEDYVKTIRSIVKNKINYNKSVLDNDYFRHVFPPAE